MTVIHNLSEPRTNGVTILMANQVLFTQAPTMEDRKFMEFCVYQFNEYQKGRPPNA